MLDGQTKNDEKNAVYMQFNFVVRVRNGIFFISEWDIHIQSSTKAPMISMMLGSCVITIHIGIRKIAITEKDTLNQRCSGHFFNSVRKIIANKIETKLANYGAVSVVLQSGLTAAQ
jgi:hypothetical protein